MIENTGVRLIYFNVLEDGLIVMSYTKPIKYSIIAIWKNQTQNTA